MPLIPGILNGGIVLQGPATAGTSGQALLGDGAGGVEFGDVAGSDNRVPLVIFIGESNPGGYGKNSDASAGELTSTSAVKIWDNDNNDGFDDLDIGANNLRGHTGLTGVDDPDIGGSTTIDQSRHGWELQLSNSVEAGDWGVDSVYLVKCGQGGSKISDWSAGGSYMTTATTRISGAIAAIKALGKTPIVYVWLSIGINDDIAGTSMLAFKTGLAEWITRIRALTGFAPVVMTDFDGMSRTALTAAVVEAASAIPFAYSVDTSAASILGDGNHWSYAGAKTVTNLLIGVSLDTVGQGDDYEQSQAKFLQSALPVVEFTDSGSQSIPADTWTAVDWTDLVGATDEGSGVIKKASGSTHGGRGNFSIDATQPFAIEMELPSQTLGNSIILYLDDALSIDYDWQSGLEFVTGVYQFTGTDNDVYAAVGGYSAADTGDNVTGYPAVLRLVKDGSDVVYRLSNDGGSTFTDIFTATGVLTGVSTAYMKVLITNFESNSNAQVTGRVYIGDLSAGDNPPTGAAGGDLSGTYPNPTIGTGKVTSAHIADGTIVNGDISASAAIALSKLATDPLARANHTGTQTADTITDGTTNKAYTATEKTKLSGIATGATANSSDATLLARANHTGTQTASTISDFNSAALAAAPAETVTTIGSLTTGATAKTTPVDADQVGIVDSAASNVWKKVTWANIKATLKSYFDGLYQAVSTRLSEIAAITVGKGKLIVGSATAWDVLAAGTDGYVLTADAAQTLGVKWAAASGGGGSASIPVVTKTSNYTPVAGDQGKLIDCTSALTLSMTAAATLGDGWFCYVRNSISGRAIADAVVIDPNSTELIDGLSTITMYHGEVRLIVCTGTAFVTTMLVGHDVIITTSGTYIPPTGASLAVDLGAGGGGGAGGVSAGTGVNHQGGSGGGGGAHDFRLLGPTEFTPGTGITATIGAGGTGGAAGTNGNPGSATTFGSYLSACGGGGGLAGTGSKSGGGGGGVGGVGQVGQTAGIASGGVPADATGGNGQGGAGGSATSNAAGACSEDGGAGGGGVGSDGTARAGGQSKKGGGGGGGGGGYSTAEGNMASAAGGDVNPASTALSSGGGGTAVSANSSSNGGNGADGDGIGGEGGGGGGGGNSINGGIGGNGGAGLGGGGGGGGGGGNTGGAGGNGGRGECRVKAIPVN